MTLFQALAGFTLASVVGICIGSISSFSERFARALQPILIAVEATPKIALAPLIIVAFGYGMGSKIVLATTVAFFPVFLGTVAGLRAAEQGRLDVLRALGASRLQMFRLVALPGALPHIFAGINVAVVFALLAAIVGEFMGSKEGLGTLILYANGNLDTARVFSILLVLAATGLTLHGLIGVLRRRLLFWDAARDGSLFHCQRMNLSLTRNAQRSRHARHARAGRHLQPAPLRQRPPPLRLGADTASLVLHLEEILRARTRAHLLQVLELHRPPQPRARIRQLHHLNFCGVP